MKSNLLRFILLVASVSLVRAGAAEPKPNIVLMIADDLGYGDLGCYGATKIVTPRLDSLATQGVRFTDAHSYSGICVPSRYTLLSGRYAFRGKRGMGAGSYACQFEDSQVLLPGVLKSAGYRTAMLGKWHNGFGREPTVNWNAELKPGPLEFGFDSFFGTPRTHSEPPLVYVQDRWIVGLEKDDPISVDHSPGTGAHGQQVGGKKAMAMRPADHIDLTLAREADRFFSATDQAKPFFLYLAWSAPHNPLSPSAEFQGRSQAGRYGDFIAQLDHCVGLVLDSLEKHGLAENTLVLFTSDNGGRYESASLRAGHRTNSSLLGQKTDAWEGGHRVPLLARWPGRIPRDSERRELFHHVDLMATLAAVGSAVMPPGASPDGHSEIAAFTAPVASPAQRVEAVLHGTASMALRQANWIYLPKPGSGGKTVPEPARPFGPAYAKLGLTNSDVDERGQLKPDAPADQLYDLTADPSQTTNLALREPQRLKAMRDRFREMAGAAADKTPAGDD